MKPAGRLELLDCESPDPNADPVAIEYERRHLAIINAVFRERIAHLELALLRCCGRTKH
jgi:hypothetical protein